MSNLKATSGRSIAESNTAPRTESNSMLGAIRVLVLIGALSLIAIGVLAGSTGFLVSFLEPSDQLILITVSVSTMALTVGLGSALAWQAWQSIQGHGSQIFRPRYAWLWGMMFLLAVGLGHVVLQSQFVPSLIFPPLHVLASVLPPLIVVALAGRSLGGVTRSRDIVFQLSSGALVATVLAFTLEITLVIGMVVILLAFVAVQPGGLEQIQTLAGHLQDPAWLEDPGSLSSLARSPLVIFSAFFVFAIAVPLIEEVVKTIGVPLRSYRRPNMSQALMWGLAGGAGFALAEGLFNSLGGMDSWAVIVSFRLGATLLHCLTGALMGLAWYYALIERRWGRGLGLCAISVGIHSLWNTLVAGMAFVSLGAQGSELTGIGQMAGELGTVVTFSLLAILACAVAASLVGLTRFVRSRSAAAASKAQPVSPETETVLATDVPGE